MELHGNARLTPHGRTLMCRRVRVEGWTVREAATAAGCSERTCYRWLARFDAGQELTDRSSAPRSVAVRGPRWVVQALCECWLVVGGPGSGELDRTRGGATSEFVAVPAYDPLVASLLHQDRRELRELASSMGPGVGTRERATRVERVFCSGIRARLMRSDQLDRFGRLSWASEWTDDLGSGWTTADVRSVCDGHWASPRPGTGPIRTVRRRLTPDLPRSRSGLKGSSEMSGSGDRDSQQPTGGLACARFGHRSYPESPLIARLRGWRRSTAWLGQSTQTGHQDVDQVASVVARVVLRSDAETPDPAHELAGMDVGTDLTS